MVVLTGNNLGTRQKELNLKVNEAAANGMDLNETKAENGESDVDNLFKIDLASKYRNIDYILEVLKSGDSLYISRALKCIWLYDDEFAKKINPDFLHLNVFPFISMKMKNKLLSTVSKHITDENRAADFYSYCVDSKMSNLALKFLIFTSESFKINVITEDSGRLRIIKESEYLRYFIRNSFALANIYLKELKTNDTLSELRYLYTVSAVHYLELIEKYENTRGLCHWKRRLGLRISTDFMKKHKSRIFKHPFLYLNLLNKHTLTKYTTVDDAKLYAVILVPQKHYWMNNYYGLYKHILDRIPFDERLACLKNIYIEKYPGQEFEMCLDFYRLEYYNLMTPEEKEAWALRHIGSEAEILGSGQDYIWYKFVNFETAFVGLKKYILITRDANNRLEIMKIMIEAAKTQQELHKLLQYFYERHINEEAYIKGCFMRSVSDHHKVVEFNDDCWTAFNKILFNLDVYEDSYGYFVDIFRIISLIYHIINNKDVPDALIRFINTEAIKIHYLIEDCNKLNEEKREMVFQYMLQFYENKMEQFDKETYDDNLKEKVRPFIYSVLNFLTDFHKTKESIPAIFLKYIKLDSDGFKDSHLFKINVETPTQDNFIRYLKQDAKLVVDKLPLVKENMGRFVKHNRLLRKIDVYFSDDIAKDYLDFCKSLLSSPELQNYVAKTAVYAIFQLANERSKIAFMMQHVPAAPKIDHVNICRKELYIQKAICAYACKSRPPVPLANMLMYIKGDYVHACLPMFDSYSANLPLPCCLEFVKSIIDSPLSIQKHGIRLAFQCFSVENLNKLISDIWKKTKNVSLRIIIYKALFNKILKEHEREQNELFEVLKTFTLDLNENDDDELYALVTSNVLPDNFIGEHLECLWKAVNKLPHKSKNIIRMCKVLNCIEQKLNTFPQSVLHSIIDDHINEMFKNKQILNTELTKDIRELIRVKWELITAYIVHGLYQTEELEKRLELVHNVIQNCLEMWNEVSNNTYVTRKFCSEFIQNLESKTDQHFVKSYENMNIIFEAILRDLEDTLSVHEIYMLVWDLRVSIVTREAVTSANHKFAEENSNHMIIQILKETSVIVAKRLRNLINEYIEKDLLYTFYFTQIVDKITTKLQRLVRCVPEFRVLAFIMEDVCVLISDTFVEIETPQLFIFALLLLPSYQSVRFPEIYLHVIEKIKAFDNGELQCILKQKFLNDFTCRKFI